MGTTCTKIKTLKSGFWTKLNKRSAKVTPLSSPTPPIRSSSSILREMEKDGLFTNTKPGGLSYSVQNENGIKIPRRLPKLILKKRKPTADDIYTSEEKELLVEIRRRGILEEKGKMAKQHSQRRKEVLERKRNRKDIEEEKEKD